MAAVLVARAGDRHEPGLGLEQEVVARAPDERSGPAVAADREVDEPRVDRREGVVAEAESGQAVGPEVLDEHVAGRQEAPQDVSAGGLLQVEPQAALVAVDREVVGRGPRPALLVPDPRRAPAAGADALWRVATADVRSEVGPGPPGVQAGEHGRGVDDANAGQRTGRGRRIGGHAPMVATEPGPYRGSVSVRRAVLEVEWAVHRTLFSLTAGRVGAAPPRGSKGTLF